jgi:hypothetical protein
MNSVAEILKRVVGFVAKEPKYVARVSGDSVRVGATRDPLALNIDMAWASGEAVELHADADAVWGDRTAAREGIGAGGRTMVAKFGEFKILIHL